jgi:hypothetical protein
MTIRLISLIVFPIVIVIILKRKHVDLSREAPTYKNFDTSETYATPLILHETSNEKRSYRTEMTLLAWLAGTFRWLTNLLVCMEVFVKWHLNSNGERKLFQYAETSRDLDVSNGMLFVAEMTLLLNITCLIVSLCSGEKFFFGENGTFLRLSLLFTILTFPPVICSLILLFFNERLVTAGGLATIHLLVLIFRFASKFDEIYFCDFLRSVCLCTMLFVPVPFIGFLISDFVVELCYVSSIIYSVLP